VRGQDGGGDWSQEEQGYPKRQNTRHHRKDQQLGVIAEDQDGSFEEQPAPGEFLVERVHGVVSF
jgi:hypothetical protein